MRGKHRSAGLRGVVQVTVMINRGTLGWHWVLATIRGNEWRPTTIARGLARDLATAKAASDAVRKLLES